MQPSCPLVSLLVSEQQTPLMQSRFQGGGKLRLPSRKCILHMQHQQRPLTCTDHPKKLPPSLSNSATEPPFSADHGGCITTNHKEVSQQQSCLKCFLFPQTLVVSTEVLLIVKEADFFAEAAAVCECIDARLSTATIRVTHLFLPRISKTIQPGAFVLPSLLVMMLFS
jgi:hypothetical protein